MTLAAVTWIAPVAGAVLGASILAPLVALWFLKLRRKRRSVPSNLLWVRSLADLRANAPFQRLRPNFLLLLQILAVLAIAFALAQPEAEGFGTTGGRHVIMIDRSASMNAVETVDGDERITRLELAKRAAVERVRALLGGGWFSTNASDVMVVAFGSRAEIRAPFTDSIAALESAIEAITPTDESTRIAEAIELSRAFTANDRPDEVETALLADPPTIELYSDGRIDDLSTIALRTGEALIYHRVGEAAANIAVVAVSADRPPEQPDRIQVFAAVVNPRTEPVKASLQLAVNGTVRALTPEPIEIPAAVERDGQFIAGRSQVVFRPIEQPSNAAIEVAVVDDDALRDDDAALAVVPPAKRLAVLHVGEGGFVVRTLLEGLPIERFASRPVAEFDALVAAGDLGSWDVIVLDGVAPKSLPAGRYLALGAAPPVAGLAAYGTQQGVYPRIVRDEHPLFRSASLEELFVSKLTAVTVDKSFQVHAEATEGPLVVSLDRADLHLVYVAFDPLDSNWPFQRSFVNFMANAVELLGRAGDAVTGRALAPGEAISMRLPPGSRDGIVLLPDGGESKADIDADGSLSWGPVRLAGLHRVTFLEPGRDDRGERLVAVNIADPSEARIAPLESLSIGTKDVQGISVASSQRGALWPWVLALGLLIVLVEWWWYQRQIRL
ncbi:MAG: vWA domain-containing protein [Planctomycetota bacterium]